MVNNHQTTGSTVVKKHGQQSFRNMVRTLDWFGARCFLAGACARTSTHAVARTRTRARTPARARARPRTRTPARTPSRARLRAHALACTCPHVRAHAPACVSGRARRRLCKNCPRRKVTNQKLQFGSGIRNGNFITHMQYYYYSRLLLPPPALIPTIIIIFVSTTPGCKFHIPVFAGVILYYRGLISNFAHV
jgi:hypothetical protein